MKVIFGFIMLAFLSPSALAEGRNEEFFAGQAQQIVCQYISGMNIVGSHDETSDIWLPCEAELPQLNIKLTSFQEISAPGVNGPAVGEYSGYVEFQEASGSLSVIFIDKMLWTGEDISMEIHLAQK